MRYHRARAKQFFKNIAYQSVVVVNNLIKIARMRYAALLLTSITALLFFGRYITELNTFVFNDDGEITVHETYTQDPRIAMAEAGIFISKYDLVTYPDAPIRGSSAEIVIERSFYVTVCYDGNEILVKTPNGTCLDALKQSGFVPQEGDVYSPSSLTPVSPGLRIEVMRTKAYSQEVYADIPFEEIRKKNTHMNANTEVVIQDGIPGKKTYVYEIREEDGTIVSKSLAKVFVSAVPVTQVTEYGVRRIHEEVPIIDTTVTALSDAIVFDENNPRPEPGKEFAGSISYDSAGVKFTYSRRLECLATAYTTENKARKVNALGNVARVGTIAVDRKIIPLKTKVYVTSTNGTWDYGYAICEDVGGFRGYMVDLFFDTRDECIKFGKKKAIIYVLD